MIPHCPVTAQVPLIAASLCAWRQQCLCMSQAVRAALGTRPEPAVDEYKLLKVNKNEPCEPILIFFCRFQKLQTISSRLAALSKGSMDCLCRSSATSSPDSHR